MIFPNIIVINENAPDDGADIMQNYISVQKKNVNKLVEGLKHFMPNEEFKTYTWEEYEASKKEKKVNPNNSK